MVLSSYLEHWRVYPVREVTAETAPVVADLWTKPIGLSHLISPPVASHKLQPPSPVIIITQPDS